MSFVQIGVWLIGLVYAVFLTAVHKEKFALFKRFSLQALYANNVRTKSDDMNINVVRVEINGL